ncbi:MAG: CsbD family protein [Chlorobia bacterium]|nr:CsbD family protein [Fimbriimonadaceae bacterium]
MNWDTVQGNWTQWKGKLKEKWGDLTDDDIQMLDGKKDQLAGKLQERYGIAREEAERQLDEWTSSIDEPARR